MSITVIRLNTKWNHSHNNVASSINSKLIGKCGALCHISLEFNTLPRISEAYKCFLGGSRACVFPRNILYVFILCGCVIAAMCASVISPVLSLCLTSFTDNVKGANTTADSYNASTEVWYDYNTSTGWECNKKTSLPIFNNEHNSFPIHTRQIPQTQFFYTTTVLPEINTDELMDRISNFTNDVQRDIVSNQQRYCPYTDLCTVSSLLSFDKNYFKKPCCNRCSCDRKTCFIYQTCCPEIIQYPTREMLHDNNKQLMEIMGMIGEDGQAKRSCLSLSLKSKYM